MSNPLIDEIEELTEKVANYRNTAKIHQKKIDRQQKEIDRLRAELDALKLHHDELLHYNEQHRAELTEARRVIDEARRQVPAAWMSPGKERVEFSRPDTVYGSHTLPLYAAPVPAQPADLRKTEGYALGMMDAKDMLSESAVPEAVAKDALLDIPMGCNALSDAAWMMVQTLPKLSGDVSNNIKPALRLAIQHYNAAMLAAADDEVGK